MHRLTAILLTALTLTTIAVITAPDGHAATISFDIDFATDPDIGITGPPGTITEVGAVNLPALGAFADAFDCDATIDVHNNESVRQGTDIVITAGGRELVLANVEAVAGNAPPRPLGRLFRLAALTRVAAFVRFGSEGVASVDADIHFTCVEVTPPPPPPPPAPKTPPPPAEQIVTVQPRTAG